MATDKKGNKTAEELKAEMEKETETAEVEAAPVAKHPQTAKIKLPLTRQEKDDVFVGLNGKTYLIKRGVEVEVPWGVAKVLERREKMLAISMEYEAQAAAPLAELEKR